MIKQLIKASLCALAILVMMPACAQGTFDEVTFPEAFVGTK